VGSYLVFNVEVLHALEQYVDLWDDLEELVVQGGGVVLEAWQDVPHAEWGYMYEVMMMLMSSPNYLKKTLRISFLFLSLGEGGVRVVYFGDFVVAVQGVLRAFEDGLQCGFHEYGEQGL
jgi:hypothetical protein